MKAWVLHGINDLRLEDRPTPALGEGEVLVKVRAAGICGSDLPRVFETGAHRTPLIPGHEFAGVAVDAAGGVPSDWIGKRVGAFPLIPCMRCDSCARGRYETCSDYDYLGSRRDGAFAEYVAVPSRNLIALPDAMGFESAAMLEPAAVALHAVRRFDLRGVENAAVVGTGTIGRLVARWMEIFGVGTVALIGGNDAPTREFDVCFEAAGGASSLRRCIELLRPNGLLVSVGNPPADFGLSQRSYWRILRKQLTVKGSWNASFPSDWEETIRFAAKLGLPELVSHRYAFDELREALAMLREGREKRGKTLIAYDENPV
jgi:L-iditol 2-dehydrogenase